MNNFYSYTLEKYKGKTTRHECPACHTKGKFTRYVDEQGNYLADHVGRCDRESSCGYHYTPKQFFTDNPSWSGSAPIRIQPQLRQPTPPKIKPIDFIPNEYLERSRSNRNNLFRFLCEFFTADEIAKVADLYQVGSTKDEAIIYWQIDTEGRVRTGKIMQYNPTTGRRDGYINWVHSLMKNNGYLSNDFELGQSLFGEHLLSVEAYKDMPVALVESEKSALICAIAMPQYIWMATGGKSQLNGRTHILEGRKVVAFCDADGQGDWKKAVSMFPNIILSNLFEDITEEESQSGYDIADLILIEKILSNGIDHQRWAWKEVNEKFIVQAEEKKEKEWARYVYTKRKWAEFWEYGSYDYRKQPHKTEAQILWNNLCEDYPVWAKFRDKFGLEVVKIETW